MYSLVTELEDVLLQLLERAHPDEDEWKQWLNAGDRRRIDDLWKRARDKDLQLHKIRYATLNQILAISAHSPSVRSVAEQDLGSDWLIRMGWIRKHVRNRIAHPGTNLVSEPGDIPNIASACEFAEQALTHLTAAQDRVAGPR